MKEKHTPVRSPDNERVSISMPRSLLEKIDAKAKADFQNRSQFMVKHLTALFERISALPIAETHPEAPQILPMVADAKTSSLSTPARGVLRVKYPAARTRKKA